jgi:hypothetical protein
MGLSWPCYLQQIPFERLKGTSFHYRQEIMDRFLDERSGGE